MKKLFIYLTFCAAVGTTIFYSCSSDSNSHQDINGKQINTKDIDPDVIGELDVNGDFQLTVDTTAVLDNWNYNLLEHGNIDAQLTNLVTFREGSILYLRATGTYWSSTLPIEVSSTGFGKSGSVSCTSSDCSMSTEGCLPKEDKTCSNCMQGRGDCTRTVTSSAALTTRYLAKYEITFD
jgi:hypothetical protein